MKGFPLDNPPSWDEYLTFDPYRTGHIRNILFEKNLIFFWNRFKYMLSYWLLQKEYTKSPSQNVKLKVYLPYCRSHPAHVDDVWPMSQLLGCSSNQFYLGVIKNSILQKFAIPKFRFQWDAILCFFTHLKFTGFDGNIW